MEALQIVEVCEKPVTDEELKVDKKLKPIGCAVGRDCLRNTRHYDARTDPNRTLYVSVIHKRRQQAMNQLTEVLQRLGYRPVWKEEKDLVLKTYWKSPEEDSGENT